MKPSVQIFPVCKSSLQPPLKICGFCPFSKSSEKSVFAPAATFRSSMNQPGFATPGSVAYENRMTTFCRPAYGVRSYASLRKTAVGYSPWARSAGCVGGVPYDPLDPVMPFPNCAWQEFAVGLTAAGVVYPFLDARDVYVVPPSVETRTKA